MAKLHIHDHLLPIFLINFINTLAKTINYRESFNSNSSKKRLSDLALIWELSLVCFSLCSRPILISNTITPFCLYNHFKRQNQTRIYTSNIGQTDLQQALQTSIVHTNWVAISVLQSDVQICLGLKQHKGDGKGEVSFWLLCKTLAAVIFLKVTYEAQVLLPLACFVAMSTFCDHCVISTRYH